MSSSTYSNPFAASSEAQLYTAIHSPVPGGNGNPEADSLLGAGPDGDEPLTPPNPNRFSTFSPSIGTGSGDSVRDSVVSEANSTQPISAAPAAFAGAGAGLGLGSGLGTADASKERVADVDESELLSDESPSPVGSKGGRSRRFWLIAAALGLLVVAAAIAIPVALVVGRKSSNNKSSSSSSSSGGSGQNNGGGGTGTPSTNTVTTGGDGSTVTTEDGSTFTYVNKLGGFWVDDPNDPFSNNAQPNSWTPPLNTSWRWGIDKVYGVNLGGLFVLEPFIVPSLFQKYISNSSINVIDEWTLSQAMAADTSGGGGLGQLEDHYNTFITEEDIAQIAGAGLNWVRLPIPFWAVDEWKTPYVDEPFLARTSWKYILRIFRWCRKYGLRINLDLHTAPGSQNGYNHSGKSGQINFMRGVMGYANAQRMLGYIRIITEFISQPEYKDLVPMFGIINEARTADIGKDIMTHVRWYSYLQAHDMMRNITGYGEGNGPFISIHDGFQGLSTWADFLPGSDRINIDTHPYFAFNGQPNTDPIEDWPPRACTWGAGINNSQTNFGVTVAGEFSNGINDCGLFLNGVSNTHSYGGDCSYWEDSTQWNQTIIDGLRTFAMASMDALQNWFFWTWKIGNSSTTGTVQSPLWSYKAGLEGGWMPTDPRAANGTCQSLGASSGTSFDGTFSAWQTGGAGAGTISPDVRASYTAWPPASISGVTGDVSLVPTYTPTATVDTLPADTFTDAPKTVSVGDGWTDESDTAGGVTEVTGCSYPNAWDSSGVTLPSTTCTGSAAGARFARRTPPPLV